MKKALIIFAGLVLSAVAFNGCKKGENDPFMSFKGRDGRLTNKWKLTKIEGTGVSTNIVGSYTITTTTTNTFDGTAYTSTSTSTGGSSSTTSTGTATGLFEMTIDKHGKVSYTETFTPSGSTADVLTGDGSWQWINSSKNKEYILIDGASNLFGGGLFYVERLAGKEMVLRYTSKSVNNGDVSSSDDKYTFTKQ